MKILQIISTGPLAWGTGGPSRGVYELSKALVERGHEVTIVTTDLYQPKKRYMRITNPEYIDGIRIYRFRNISDYLVWKHHISISLGVTKYFKTHLSEYDIVHLQDLLSFHAISTINYCRSNKIPFIFTPHGSLPWLNEKKPLNLLYKKFWGNGILMKAKKIICLNQVEIAQCERLGVPKDRLVIVPNGVNLDEYVNLPQKGSFRKRWSISNDQKIILFLARIHKIKGPDLLAKAFTLISKNNNNLKLVFAGPDGGYLTFLKGLIRELGIEEKVLFTGPLYERDKFEAYVDADVYVLPSVYETFPISIIEACACGTPVIVTDRCGIANIIDGQVGLVVPYNADALGEAILNILSDDNKKQEYGARGKLLVQDKLNWTNISEKLETVYINTLKQSPPSSKKYEE